MSTKYVYTFSSRKTLPVALLHSIHSLRRYVNSEDIIVFATPPVDDKHLEMLRSLNIDVREREHVSNSFAAFSERPSHYGDKALLTTVKSETVVFLDCDTLVFGNPDQLITESEFRARKDTANIKAEDWLQLFAERDEPVLNWMPNCGVLVFDDGLHTRIAEKWRSYLDDELPNVHDVYHKEQYALALAVSGYRVEQMRPREHVMEWNNEIPADGIIYHQGKVFSSKNNGVIETAAIKCHKVRSKVGKYLPYSYI